MPQRLESLKALASAEPEDPFLQYAMALELVRLGSADQAMTLFNKLMEEHPAYIGTYYQAAQLAHDKGMSQIGLSIVGRGIAQMDRLVDAKSLRELSALGELIEEEME